MAKYRIVRTEFWNNPIVEEEMTPEEKYFYLYLLTNPHTTQIGIYKITKNQMAFHLGFPLEKVQALMERFIQHHKLIRYNPETRELAMKDWGKDNFHKGGKPIMDCVFSELKKVQDLTLIPYVSEAIPKEEIQELYDSFCHREEMAARNNVYDSIAMDTYTDSPYIKLDDTSPRRNTIRGQKEKENKKEKQRIGSQPNKEFAPNSVSLPNQDNASEIMEFWDVNGFGFTNVNGKQQLLAWLEDSHFLLPKEMILKAMGIACHNNKRRLNYVEAILRNWENESLLSPADVDSHQASQQAVTKSRQSTEIRSGRDVPSGFQLDLTAGEEE
jgi:DnaD/phage-associated family protein